MVFELGLVVSAGRTDDAEVLAATTEAVATRAPVAGAAELTPAPARGSVAAELRFPLRIVSFPEATWLDSGRNET